MFDVNCKLCNTFITAKSQEAANPGCGIITVTKMLDDQRFVYGISGVFKFKEKLNLGKGDSVCNICLKKHEFEPYKSVECDLCKNKFQPCWESKTESVRESGFGCAADVYYHEGKLHLYCGWGSKHDMEIYEVKTTIPEKSLICDVCVDKLIERGELVYEKEAVFGEPLTASQFKELQDSLKERLTKNK